MLPDKNRGFCDHATKNSKDETIINENPISEVTNKSIEGTVKVEDKSETLLLEGTNMPDNNVDLMDVVEAINRLCENMSSSYEGVVISEPVEERVVETETQDQSEWVDSIDWEKFELESVVESGQSVEFLKCKPRDSFVEEVMNSIQNIPSDRVQCSSIAEVDEGSPVEEIAITTPIEEPVMQSSENTETESQLDQEVIKIGLENVSMESLPYQSIEVEPIRRIEGMERWSDSASFVSLPGQSDLTSPPNIETVSEMYYTASSEVSLLSDLETADTKEEKERKGVIAGHVAAMRERFESMTRANTPCPDALRSVSPSLDARNVTPSPDLLG